MTLNYNFGQKCTHIKSDTKLDKWHQITNSQIDIKHTFAQIAQIESNKSHINQSID